MAENIKTDVEKELESVKHQLIEEKKKTLFLQQKIDSLGLQGKAKLYYALNKNMSDIADLLEGIKFKDINLESKSDATMERVKILWASIKPVAETVNILEGTTSITGNEKQDTAPRNVLEFAESRK